MDFRDVVKYEDWHYQLFSPDHINIDDRPRSTFHKLWLSKSINGQLPARSDFDFQDFAGLYGWVMIDQVQYAPFDLLTKLQGTELRELNGRDETGMTGSDLIKDPVEGEHERIYLDLHKQAAQSHMIARSWGRQLLHNRALGADWISFPCANDGKITSHFITLVCRLTLHEIKEIGR